jgi:hypothetical protein
MANAKKNSISDALQLGTTLHLSSGVQLPVLGACPVRRLDELVQLFNKGVGYKFAYLFRSENQEMCDAFLEIMYIMCGEKVDKEYILDNLTTADEVEVYKEIGRFLGLQPRDSDEKEAK